MDGREQAGDRLEFRMVTHVTCAQSQEVGDVPGHVATLSRFSGLAFFAEDTVCPVQFVALTDYINGAGVFTLYPIITFDDGSELCIKAVGTGTVHGAITKFVGTLSVVGGKGRFDRSSGDGTLTGTRYTPLAVGSDLVSEYRVNIRRPH
jgi:hypothetical protein